jgi:hypothetical protein
LIASNCRNLLSYWTPQRGIVPVEFDFIIPYAYLGAANSECVGSVSKNGFQVDEARPFRRGRARSDTTDRGLATVRENSAPRTGSRIDSHVQARPAPDAADDVKRPPKALGPDRATTGGTRKSSEEGLEQDFNSLHAQREGLEADVSV